jgi:hypothetical protein
VPITVLVVTALVLFLGTSTASLAQTPSLNWGSEVNPSRCPTDQGYRYLEINVTRKVEHDVAPGAGHFDASQTTPTPPDGWANREFNQHIQVWKIGIVEPPGEGERYCALVRYQGSFVSTGTSDPNGSAAVLENGVDGTFEGGYRLVFTAEENFTAPTRGHVQTVLTSGGATDWLPLYFINVTLDSPEPEWWGWVYHGGRNGTWVNSVGGNVQGNITGAP